MAAKRKTGPCPRCGKEKPLAAATGVCSDCWKKWCDKWRADILGEGDDDAAKPAGS